MAIDVKVPVRMASAQAITTTGNKTFFRPSYNEYTMTAVGVVVTTALAASDPATLEIDWRPTVGSDTGRVTIASMVLPAAAIVGRVFVEEGLSYRCTPGGEVVFEVTDASATGVVDMDLYGYYSYVNPANNTSVTVV
jgi:hypothetical protein